MAALSEFLSRLYALTKLFFALLFFDVVARIRSIPGAFRLPKTDPMEATLFLELVEETIPTFRYTRRGAHSNECSVCLGQIGEGERARQFRCKHLFHRDCIDGWLKRFHATCPLCRTQVLPDEVVADFRNRVMFGRRIDEETTLLLSFLHGHRSYRFM